MLRSRAFRSVLGWLAVAVGLVAGSTAPVHAQPAPAPADDASADLLPAGVTGKTGVAGPQVLSLFLQPSDAASPPTPSSGTNEAVVRQVGDANTTAIQQVGAQNTASIEQRGLEGIFDETFNPPPFSLPAGPPSGEVFDPPAFTLPTGPPFGPSRTADVDGRNNLAVSIQNGVGNTTAIRQRGARNVAGVRLDGNDNDVGVLQMGVGNRYLLDHTGNDLQRQVIQVGQGNTLVQRGNRTRPFGVIQKGGMDMRITFSGPSSK